MFKALLPVMLACLALISPAVAAPETKTSTEVFVVSPPTDWVTSVWRGGTVELGEFTPKGQTDGNYVDLLGYSVMPLVLDVPKSPKGVVAYELKTLREGCESPVIRQTPRTAGWTDLQAVCFKRPGAAAGTIEVSLISVQVTDQGYYRVWRNWRGTAADLSAMVKSRTGRAAPEHLIRAGKPDGAAVDQLLTLLNPLFWPEISGAVICDLARPMVCPALSGPLPAESLKYLKGSYIAAVYAGGLNRIDSKQFNEMMGIDGPGDGTPDRVIGTVAVEDALLVDTADWNQFVMLIATGQAADGGLLAITGKTPPMQDVVAIRRRVVMTARQVWQKDFPPASVVVSLTPTAE